MTEANARIKINKLLEEADWILPGGKGVVNVDTEKQLEIFRLVQSLHKDGLGYRRIAKVLNEKGLNTKEGHLRKNSNVYSVLKRYSERQDRLKYRRKKYPLVRGRMWMEFIR